VKKELEKLRQTPLGKLQLHQAKQQFMGQLAMAEESNIGLMLMMGKSLLDTKRVESLQEVFALIENISAQDLQDVANDVLSPDALSILSYIPQE
jgi:predicted Zn-dependent peptidase